MLSLNEQMDIIRRGTEEIISENELARKLERAIKTHTPLNIKQGFDPTAPDIHMGHTVSIRKLKQFQDLGHRVIFLIGDFTGMIGDPSGKNKTRRRLSKEEVLQNAETYKQQIFKILDPDKTVLDFNSRWCTPMTFEEVLSITARYTVARMLERDDFANRYQQGKPITLMEFLYPLVQGYDSVALEADVEMGGTDQKFNLLVGRDLQREYGQEPQVVITMPLLVGTDGTEKMSKSLGNYIGINESPGEIYGKTMSLSDPMIYPYFELATDVQASELDALKRELEDPTVSPMGIKKRLARKLVAMYHGTQAAQEAEERFEAEVQQKGIPEDVAEYVIPDSGAIWIVTLVKDSGLAASNSEARRLIQQGAVSIDGERVGDPDQEVAIQGGEILKVGKRRFVRLRRKP
ncbi:MAG: tyrosine--tRNA ligase [Candidatus Latescibacterota bacterium]